MKRLTLKNLISSFPDDASAPAGMTCEKITHPASSRPKRPEDLLEKFHPFFIPIQS